MKPSTKTKRILNLWILVICLLMGAVALQQAYTTTNGYIRLWREPLLRMWKMNSFVRSEIIYLKPYGAMFMNFLDENIPARANVSTVQNATNFSEQNILQFYLGQTRIILGAPEEKTRRDEFLKDPNIYIPAMNDFPAADVMIPKQFIAYNPDEYRIEGILSSSDAQFKGLYAASQPVSRSEGSNLTRPYQPLPTLALDLLVVAGIALLGFLLAGLVLRDLPPLAVLSLSIPLGSGLFSWVLFLLSWAGVPLTLAMVLIGYTLLAAVLFLLRWRQTRSNPFAPGLKRITWPSEINWIAVVIGAGAAFLVVTALIISIGRGYSTYDDMAIWSLKGYVMADNHTILAAGQSSGHGLAYPLNLSLNVAVFRLIDGDLLPGSKFIFFLLVASLLVGVVHFWRDQHIPIELSLLGIMGLLSIPILYLHATYGFANLPFTALLVLGTLWSVRGLLENQKRSLAIGGLLLAFAGWTRPEGIGYALVVAVALAMVHALRRGQMRSILPWLAVILAVPGIWFLFSIQFIADDQVGGAFSAMKASLMAGSFRFENLNEIVSFCIQRLEETHIWGTLLPFLLALLVVSLPRWSRRPNPAAFLIAPAALITIVGPVVLFYVEFFHNTDHFNFLITAFDRAFFPAAFFFTILVILLAGSPSALRASNPVSMEKDWLTTTH